ncbi:hypothetical protein BSL78_26046 [Apostichopus japonicus]|uniref:PDZ domain-containing protein n=1 Tax=Stichopus japonicus TaxID=307972 RepID=A0A2G8JN07_STIJA|nr:hypothetical protein BSL78_26046 [Apostichopus japonicus]
METWEELANYILLIKPRGMLDTVVLRIKLTDSYSTLGPDGYPYLEFGGFYWNSDYADMECLIPIEAPDLLSYKYNGEQENVEFRVTKGTKQLWLEVDVDDIKFTESLGAQRSEGNTSTVEHSELWRVDPMPINFGLTYYAFLVQRETINGHGKHLFIEQISPGGILYHGGIRHSDRLISVNKVPVEQFSFDLIRIDSFSLGDRVGCRKKGKWQVVPIVVISKSVQSDGHPYLEFGGFYWNSDYADIEPFIPLEVPSLNTYQYSGKQENVRFVVTEGNKQLWLEVDGDDIEFTESNGSLTSFTMYKYDPTRSPTNSQVVILVPTDQPCFCLAAKKDNDLVLW